jgi:hypothetical protein
MTMNGCRVKIWKQDPSVISIGIRTCFIPSAVAAGPKDDKIQIAGLSPVLPNTEGDFLFDPAANENEFDAVHTFTVIRQVLTMYERVFNRTGVWDVFNWQWGKDPVTVYPHAGVEANAYYSRNERALRFFYFRPSGTDEALQLYTCRSFDIVAHETGHAILDALKPGFLESWHPQTGGMHEAFGDLTAIFTMLAQMDQCEAIIAESKADLHIKTFFPAVAEQFGEAFYGHRMGLRNADNDLKLSDVSNEVHAISQVLTGAVYDIMADIFDVYKNFDRHDPAETLYKVGKHMISLLVVSILQLPDKNATYRNLAEKMIALEPQEEWKPLIHKQFTIREIIGDNAAQPLKQPVALSFNNCSGTLQHPEQIRRVQEAALKVNR